MYLCYFVKVGNFFVGLIHNLLNDQGNNMCSTMSCSNMSDMLGHDLSCFLGITLQFAQMQRFSVGGHFPKARLYVLACSSNMMSDLGVIVFGQYSSTV